MGFQKETGLQEWVHVHEFPVHFSVNAPVLKKTYHVVAPHRGRCNSLQLAFDEVLISYSSMHIDQTIQLQRDVKGDSIEMIFILEGSSDAILSTHEQHFFLEGQHNIYYGSGVGGEFTLRSDSGQLEFVVIHLSKSYYLRLLYAGSALQQKFTENMISGRAGFISANNLQITSAMKLAIDEIKKCQRIGMVKRIFLEVKVLELLMLQIEQVEQEAYQQEHYLLKSGEYHLLTEAKKILEEHLFQPPTISQLSKRIGLNEFLLKKKFKEAFGKTIFGYVTQLKMQQAKYLLLQEGKTVSETADLVGYKNPQHFTAAFKRFYGMLPSELKRLQ